MKALRIHPNPFVTAGFLVAFCMLLAFLYGLPMLTSQADEGEDEDASAKSLECDFFPEQCDCNPIYCTPPAPTQCPNPHECTRPTATPIATPEPTRDCNGPFHPSCFTATPSPTPDPTTPPPTTRPTATSTPLRPPPAPTGLSGTAINCDDEHCDVKFTWSEKSGYGRYRIY